MKKIFTLFFTFASLFVLAQPTYIGLTVDNNGSGNNNLFGNCLNTSQDAYVNWEVYLPDNTSCGADGTDGNNGGTSDRQSHCRLILRTSTTTSDPTTVIASAPTIIDPLSIGASGGFYQPGATNNDGYFVNLKDYITTPGYYSVEIQCTCMDGVYDNEARTTWNYGSPNPYWSSPSPDLINNSTGGTMPQINNALLGYFTVGDVDMYRSMVVFNGTYYDLLRFTPGNPPAPTNLQSATGSTAAPLSSPICGGLNAPTPPTLSMGAEMNIFKRNYGGCLANVTDCRTYYRVYKQGTTPPSFTTFNVSWQSNCTGGYNASTNTISTFTSGGSCISGQTQGTNNSNLANCIASERWQAPIGASNILPTSFTSADAGTWQVDYYNECDLVNCAGTTSVESDPATAPTTYYSATFTVTAMQGSSSGAPCYTSALPIILKSFDVTLKNNIATLDWTTSSEVNSAYFNIERSNDQRSWQTIGIVNAKGHSENTAYYTFKDVTPLKGIGYYRLKMADTNGNYDYSPIKSVNLSTGIHLFVYPNPTSHTLQVTFNTATNNDVVFNIHNTNGQLVKSISQTAVEGANYASVEVSDLTDGLYIIRLTDNNGRELAQASFLKK